jgi:hypothetical protein
MSTWDEIKQKGSKHYKIGEGFIEMIDLYKSEGTLQDWAICEARHHFSRNLSSLQTLGTQKCIEDMKKCIHYAEMIICLSEEAESNNSTPCLDAAVPCQQCSRIGTSCCKGCPPLWNNWSGKEEKKECGTCSDQHECYQPPYKKPQQKS